MHSPLLAARQLVPCLCALAVMAGCGSPPRFAPLIPQVPVPPAVAAGPVAAVLPEGAAIPLGDLLALARQQAPTAELVAALRASAVAVQRQSTAWSNPEVELRSGISRVREGGTADRRTWGGDLRQRFELPGKRATRISAAQAGEAVAGFEVAQAWLDLEAEVRAAAVVFSVSQAALLRTQASAELAAGLRQTVEHRAQAGEAAKADLARARLEEATAGIATVARQREMMAARGVVQHWCGAALPDSFTIPDAVPDQPGVISLPEVLRQAQEQHPQLRLRAAQLGQRTAEVGRERAAWLPDVTLGLSADRAADTDEVAVSLGFDLPLWNRGDAAVAVAEAERSRTAASLRSESRAVERTIITAWNAYESARLELAALVSQARPVAEEAVRLRQAAYAAGEDSLADVLEARRAAQAVAEAELGARRVAAEAGIALGRAVGSFTFASESHKP